MSKYTCWLWIALIFSFVIVGYSSTGKPLMGSKLIVLEGGTLIDGTGGEPRPNAVVAIDGSKIVAVGVKGEFHYPPDATVRDVTGHYVIPGLTDMHAHVPVGSINLEKVNGMERCNWVTMRRQRNCT